MTGQFHDMPTCGGAKANLSARSCSGKYTAVTLQEGKGHSSKHSWRPAHASVAKATPSIVVMNLR